MFGYTESGQMIFDGVTQNHPADNISPAISRGVVEPAEQGTADPSAPRRGTGEHVRAQEYARVETGGKELVQEGPLTRSADPIRRGDTPARFATSRFYHDLRPWIPDEIELWSEDEDRYSIERQQNVAGGMVRGRMDAMDEYRMLHDGSHA